MTKTKRFLIRIYFDEIRKAKNKERALKNAREFYDRENLKIKFVKELENG
jgi:hypothetical protein